MKGLNIGKAKGNYFVTLITLIILCGSLAYYFLIFIPNNEAYIVERNFRELNQISNNLSSRSKSLIGNAKNILESDPILKEIGRSLQKLGISNIENHNKVENLLLLDSLESKINKQVDLFNSKISISELDFFYDVKHAHKEKPIDLHIKIPKQTSILYTAHIELNRDTVMSMLCPVEQKKAKNHYLSLEYKVEVTSEDLISDLLHYDQFEHFIITKDKWLIFESHPSGSFVYNNAILDSLGSVQSSFVRQLNLNGIEYDTYIRPLFISEDEKWNLVGFVRSDRVVEETRNIPLRISLFLCIASLFIILLIPFIKLLLVNKKEPLSVYDLGMSYLSILLSVSMIVITLVWLVFYQIDKKHINNKLESLSYNISNSFEMELDLILKMMNGFEFDDSISDTVSINSSSISSYPYFEVLALIDSSGVQIKKTTTKTNLTPKIIVAKRKYFNSYQDQTHFTKKLDGTNHNTSFYVESIVSHNTGKKLGTISIKKTDSDSVYATTTRLHSLIEVLMPPGFGYAIINRSGEVFFHSDTDKNLTENFLNEFTANQELEGLISAEKTGFVSGEYHNKRIRLYKDQLEGNISGIYLLSYYNSELTYNKYARIILLVVATLLFLYLAVLIGLFFYLKIKKIYLSELKIFKSNWEEPAIKKNPFFVLKKDFYSRKRLKIFYLNVGLPLFLLFIFYQSELASFKQYEKIVRKEAKTLKEVTEKIYVDEIIGTRNSEAKKIKSSYSRIYPSLKKHLTPQNYIKNDSIALYQISGRYDSHLTSPDKNFLFSMPGVVPIVSLDYILNKLRPHLVINISSRWILTPSLLVVLFLVGYLILLAVDFAIHQIDQRLLVTDVRSSANYKFKNMLTEFENQRSFLVVIDNSSEEFQNFMKSKNHTVSWETYKWDTIGEDLNHDSNLTKNSTLSDTLIIFDFPYKPEDIRTEDLNALDRLPDKNVILISKQSPLILAKVISENNPDLFFKFNEILSEFETYYVKLQAKNALWNNNSSLKSHFRFLKILNYLSPEEKYVLYDLAVDNVMNVQNYPIINSLYKKGIIVGDYLDKNSTKLGNIRFFDEDKAFDKNPGKASFRNTILETVSYKTILAVNKSSEYKSTWAKYRTPLVVIAVGVFIFIMFTQEEYFNRAIGIVSSLLAAVGLISRFTNTLSLNFEKSSSKSENQIA